MHSFDYRGLGDQSNLDPSAQLLPNVGNQMKLLHQPAKWGKKEGKFSLILYRKDVKAKDQCHRTKFSYLRSCDTRNFNYRTTPQLLIVEGHLVLV